MQQVQFTQQRRLLEPLPVSELATQLGQEPHSGSADKRQLSLAQDEGITNASFGMCRVLPFKKKTPVVLHLSIIKGAT